MLVGGATPNPTAGCGAVTTWTILSELRAQGHDVAVVVVRDRQRYDPTSETEDAREERIRGLGAEVVPVISRSAITGFSLGTCIVSHRANSLGIPELDHEQNALLGSSRPELAEGVVRAFRDDALRRRLESGARETYERQFAPPVSVGRIAANLEEMAPGRRPVHARSATS